jgi:hypothetical protein
VSSLLTFPQPDLSALERVKEYFRSRRNYSFEGSYIIYDNDVTGCSFTIEFNPFGDADEEGNPNHAIGFILNYNRSKPFIREAIAEVSAFNKGFPGKFINEETEHLENFDAGRYFANWSRANDKFVRGFTAMPDCEEAFAPSAAIETAWAWNAACDTQMEALEEDVFIAPVSWLRTVTSSAVPCGLWTETIPTIFPSFVERLAIGTSSKYQSSSQNQSIDSHTIFRFVPIEIVLANTDFEQRTVNSIPAYATTDGVPASLLKAIEFITPGLSDGEYLVHPSLVLEAEILSLPHRSYNS